MGSLCNHRLSLQKVASCNFWIESHLLLVVDQGVGLRAEYLVFFGLGFSPYEGYFWPPQGNNAAMRKKSL